MSGDDTTYVHATALVVGECGLLIRGPSGVGKSSLAAALLTEGRRSGCFARLVGDDRIALTARNERLLARPHPAIAGRIERRFGGLQSVLHEPSAVIRHVVDLVADGVPPRLPAEEARFVELHTVRLPRLLLPKCPDEAARQLLLEWIRGLVEV